MAKRVVVVDDDKSFLKSIGMILSRNGFDVMKSATGTEALQLIHENVDDIVAVVTDLSMPGGVDGIDILERVKSFGRDIPVILITAYGNIEIAVDAMRKGAFTFLAKPINFKVLIAQLRKAVRTADIIQQNKVLRKEIDTIEKDKYGLVYNSESMRKLIDSACEIAKTDETVLISGESGTGKELIARLILRNSPRRLSKFVAFNASAVSDTLMDAELFGHKKGAFTGAHADKPGYIGEAEGGTLFIDEIGDMPFELQSKLLRFLQEKEYMPVGGSVPRKSDIRIISATNKNLRDEVEKENFREDLYYRLSVFPLRVPPLRERPEDIPVLVDYFLEKLNKEYKKNVKRPDSKIMRELSKKEWKGNVRELRNFTARYILSSGDVSMTTDKGFSSQSNTSDVVSFKIGELTLKEIEKKIIKSTLKYTGGNKKETAELLDVSQRTIYRKLTDEDV